MLNRKSNDLSPVSILNHFRGTPNLIAFGVEPTEVMPGFLIETSRAPVVRSSFRGANRTRRFVTTRRPPRLNGTAEGKYPARCENTISSSGRSLTLDLDMARTSLENWGPPV